MLRQGNRWIDPTMSLILLGLAITIVSLFSYIQAFRRKKVEAAKREAQTRNEAGFW
jgi:hypothetical protein